MKTTMLLPLLGLVGAIGSSACTTVYRQPVYEEPVSYAQPEYVPTREVVVEHDGYYPSSYNTVYVHSRGRGYYAHDDVEHDGYARGGDVVHHVGYGRGSDTTVIVNNGHGGGRDNGHGRGNGGGHDNGRGNGGQNNGHGNGGNQGRGGGNGNGHSRGRG